MLSGHLEQDGDGLNDGLSPIHKLLIEYLRKAQQPVPVSRVQRDWKECAQEIAAAHGVAWDSIIEDKRARHIVRARWAIMAMMRQRGMSLPRIGGLLGGMDHTSVLNGLRRYAEEQAALDVTHD